MLSSLPSLYEQNIIEFMSLTTNSVTFTFDGLPSPHKKIIVRARVYT
jgi:hypothetical protein